PAANSSQPASPPPPRFAAAVNVWISDVDAYNAAYEKHGAAVTEDMPNYTNTRPIIQFDKAYGEMGAARATPKIGDSCLTILYPNSEGVRWDVDYYKKGHMPLIMKLYGEKAIKRFELRRGETGTTPDTQAAFIGS